LEVTVSETETFLLVNTKNEELIYGSFHPNSNFFRRGKNRIL
jgi:hypothetical protein